MNDAPTPAELRELAARAEALAAEITGTYERLHAAADEPTRRAGFRLPDTAGYIKGAAAELHDTAADLARIRGRSACSADWGLCPKHGNTLSSSGGQSWCRTPECGRRWDYDRGGLPCEEPPMFEVRDSAGATTFMCGGHAYAAQRSLIGATFTPITGAGQ
jgi:hypothetical protein